MGFHKKLKLFLLFCLSFFASIFLFSKQSYAATCGTNGAGVSGNDSLYYACTTSGDVGALWISDQSSKDSISTTVTAKLSDLTNMKVKAYLHGAVLSANANCGVNNGSCDGFQADYLKLVNTSSQIYGNYKAADGYSGYGAISVDCKNDGYGCTFNRPRIYWQGTIYSNVQEITIDLQYISNNETPTKVNPDGSKYYEIPIQAFRCKRGNYVECFSQTSNLHITIPDVQVPSGATFDGDSKATLLSSNSYLSTTSTATGEVIGSPSDYQYRAHFRHSLKLSDPNPVSSDDNFHTKFCIKQSLKIYDKSGKILENNGEKNYGDYGCSGTNTPTKDFPKDGNGNATRFSDNSLNPTFEADIDAIRITSDDAGKIKVYCQTMYYYAAADSDGKLSNVQHSTACVTITYTVPPSKEVELTGKSELSSFTGATKNADGTYSLTELSGTAKFLHTLTLNDNGVPESISLTTNITSLSSQTLSANSLSFSTGSGGTKTGTTEATSSVNVAPGGDTSIGSKIRFCPSKWLFEYEKSATGNTLKSHDALDVCGETGIEIKVNRKWNYEVSNIEPKNDAPQYIISDSNFTATFDVDVKRDTNQPELHYITDINSDRTKIHVIQFVVSANSPMNDARFTTNDISNGLCGRFSGLYKSCDDSTTITANKYYQDSNHGRAYGDTTYKITNPSLNVSVTTPTLAVGEKFCVAVGFTQYSSTETRNYVSKAVCGTIAKKPTVHVLGGSVESDGSVVTSLSNTKNGVYGSWTDLAIIVGGNAQKIRRMSSGTAIVARVNSNPNIPCDTSPLTVANSNCGSDGIRKANINRTNDYVSRIASKYSGDKVVGSIDDLYGKVFRNGTHVFKNLTGNVTITQDIKTDSSSSRNNADVPQVIIIASGDIYITNSVSRLDAWIIAGGSVYTCVDGSNTPYYYADELPNGSPTHRLTSSDCYTPLNINGPVTSGGGTYYTRTANADVAFNNIADPAETVNFWPTYIIKGYSESTSTKAYTRYLQELAPRY